METVKIVGIKCIYCKVQHDHAMCQLYGGCTNSSQQCIGKCSFLIKTGNEVQYQQQQFNVVDIIAPVDF